MLIKIKNCIIRVLYILICLYLFVFIPSFFGHKPLVVISGSMEPILKVGGVLYYHEQDITSFKKNDILVYKTDKHIISHRIVEKTENGFLTKGDANKTVDINEINNNQVLGKGTNWSIPFLGYYADYIYHHKYLLFVSVLIIVTDLGYDVYKNRRKEKVGVLCEEKE